MTKLFAANTEDGNSNAMDFGGGPVSMVVVKSGTATVKLQMSPDEGTSWADVDGVSLTATGEKHRAHLPKCKLRLNQASSSGASVDAWVGA